MGKIIALCVSEKKGRSKTPVPSAKLVTEHGLEGDAHAGGGWHRQVSLLAHEKIEDFRKRGAIAPYGCFGENIVAEGIDFAALRIGTRLACAGAILEITQIGKECHDHCGIFHSMGECIMPTQGVFARVLLGGVVNTGDELRLFPEE
ncbi:MAG: MOSC domain-containing protein [Desulfovibrio sp.]|jgi:MOSC domain-containing protein YiiM|nr:MOSC domain-containing protein [Desulfovibrio sp.]